MEHAKAKLEILTWVKAKYAMPALYLVRLSSHDASTFSKFSFFRCQLSKSFREVSLASAI